MSLTADKDGDRLQEIEDTIGLLARNFGKMMNHSGRRMHQPMKQHVRQGGDRDSGRRREDL